jgi:hypothetical protein
MALKNYVFEIEMDDWAEFPGNQLYATQDIARYFAERDYGNAFYDKWMAGFEDAEQPGIFKWEFISRGLYHLYEDGSPTGVSLKFRYVHQEDTS